MTLFFAMKVKENANTAVNKALTDMKKVNPHSLLGEYDFSIAVEATKQDQEEWLKKFRRIPGVDEVKALMEMDL